MMEYLPSIYKAWGSDPSVLKKKKNNQNTYMVLMGTCFDTISIHKN